MNKSFSLIIQIVSVVISFAILASFAFFIHLSTPISSEENWREVEIPEGSSFSKGIRILESNGLIKNKITLLFLGKITNTDKQLKSQRLYESATDF